MKKSYWKKVSDAIKQGTLLDKIIVQWYIFMGFSNDELFPMELRYRQYKSLRKKYYSLIAGREYELSEMRESREVWVCWFQGMENAPTLVQKCYESLHKYVGNNGWKINLITKQNMSEYVQLPQNILDKWETGIITDIHMSDILRTELLIKYGGLWVDATVYFTDIIPQEFIRGTFFTYSHSYRGDLAVNFESWFIYANANHPLLLATRKMLYAYWKNNNKLIDYFLFHLFFTISTECYLDYWNQVPFYTDIVPHILSHELFSKYDEERFRQIKKMSSIHKLTYKFDEVDNEIQTYYMKIIKGEI